MLILNFSGAICGCIHMVHFDFQTSVVFIGASIQHPPQITLYFIEEKSSVEKKSQLEGQNMESQNR